MSEEYREQNENKTQLTLPWAVQTNDLEMIYEAWCDLELELLSSSYKYSAFQSQFQQCTI